ncbi:DUF4262 domain-containing protein [Pseudobacteriovorax antillogorgiicola]|uniref:DUF4262 domain-containing protein n=1 Tax=Pseudobacteriovorax antillogorgiicola TaxID=1513793 RepID=A0A1Y6B6V8_9BACT|nr:DUF4262 domain-containing protein [Pseudobacteriovorax antillogorgiicola]TCS58735.1 uncharacterized protein DUF4262 [Pseudobacteriovorax antillogorgiicola]SME95274.1 protein of unknown function [Pseudobacteriovorax antillogorgiicola]
MDSESYHCSKGIESEKAIVSDVEEYGCHLCYIPSDGYLPSFAYTIGLHKTYGHPEVIVFGLSKELLCYILNHVHEAVKQGNSFVAQNQYDEFLEGYTVKLIEVAKEHYRDYVGFGGWYYKAFDFPLLQVVWPDKMSVWPWEESFNKDWKFLQPLLDRNIDFKFYEPRNLGVYTTQQVIDGEPVVMVYHNEDGSWEFHSKYDVGEGDEAKLVCLEELVAMDPTLNEIHYLGYRSYATREGVEHSWSIHT